MKGLNKVMLQDEIKKLKEEKKAIILAHYYQPLEIQLIADFVGDSLELSRKCASSEAEAIVFCGVSFMGESAKLLCPDKRVFVPVRDAGCLMADMISEKDILKLREAHPEATVVCYINSTAATKAASDICCTSANAVRVAESVESREIIFVPDRNLGSYVAAKVKDKEFYFFDGFCPIHNFLALKDVLAAKEAHPNAPVLTHPECRAEVCDVSDFVGSTSQIIAFAENTDFEEYIICTEVGVVERMSMLFKGKRFYVPNRETLFCHNMKKISLNAVLETLKTGEGEIFIDEELRAKALLPITRMLGL